MRAAKVDGNHAMLADVYRRLGCKVRSTARLGDGFPDLLVGLGTTIALVEVKTAKGKLEPEQEEFMADFPVRVVRSEQDVLAHVAALKATIRCRVLGDDPEVFDALRSELHKGQQ
jgi:hypothetical protein